MMQLLHRDDDEIVFEAAQDLMQRYGARAPGVAREWADIKYRQGAPQTAAIWLRVAGKIDQAAEE